jgi:type IX secretion system PorP/SprF family membrane protein
MKFSINKIYKTINVKVIVIIFIVLSYASFEKVLAQTEPMYSQYMYNMLGVNPAYAGSREVLGLNFFQRNQWSGLRGAPKTTSLNLDQSISEGKIGLGIQMFSDQLGVEEASGINGFLSSRIKVSENGILSAGLSLGFMNYQFNSLDVLNRIRTDDNVFVTVIPSQWNPSVGFGLYYNTDQFYMGISSPSLLKSRLAKYENFASGIQKTDDFHLFTTMGYVIKINEEVNLKPSTMIKMVSGAPIEFDLNTNVWLRDILGLGVSYRTGDAVIGMAEIQASPNLRFGYAYDMPFSPLKAYTRGSHEIMIRYEWGNNKSKIKSTRYF